MTDVIEFPIQGIPEAADLSKYSDRDLLRQAMLIRARTYNLAEAGELEIDTEHQAVLDRIEKTLQEFGYLV